MQPSDLTTCCNLYILNAVRCPYVHTYTYVRSYIRNGWHGQLSSEWRHNKNDITMRRGRDVNETLAYETETETRPRHLVFGPRRDRDQDLPAIPRDQDENETSDFCHETRPRPCKAETETFFETFNLQHCAKQWKVTFKLIPFIPEHGTHQEMR